MFQRKYSSRRSEILLKLENILVKTELVGIHAVGKRKVAHDGVHSFEPGADAIGHYI